MTQSGLMNFVEALKTDPALKEKAVRAQQQAMAEIRRRAAPIADIARDAGFDLSEWAKRPTDGDRKPTDEETHCPLTCCAVATSTTS